MKYLASIAFTIAAFAAQAQVDRSKAPEPGPAPEIQIPEASEFKLDNGLQVIVVENHKVPRVSYQLSFDYDIFLEKEKAGANDLTGSLLTAGTENRTKAEIDEAIDFIGASLNSSASGVFGSSLTKHSKGLLEVMADVVKNPSFPADELDKARKQELSNLKSAKTDANAIASIVAPAVRYGKDHPYGEVTTEETLEAISNADLKEIYNTYYRPNVSYLVIVGDITPEAAKKQAEKYFGDWKKAPVPATDFETPKAPEQTTVVFVNKPGAVQSVVNITYPIDLKPGSDMAISSSVLNSILGGGVFSGRLMQNLREDKGFTYGARSGISTDPEVGSFTAFASVRNDVTDSSVTEFMYELNKISKEPVTPDEISLTKNVMNGGFARSLERPQTVARFALNSKRYDLPNDYYRTYLEKLESVTIDDVLNTARKVIKPKNAYILVIGNEAEVAEKLAKFSNAEIQYLDMFANPVEASVGIEIPEGLTAQSVIEDYVKTVSGISNLSKIEKKLKKVKNITTKASGSIQGLTLTMTTVQAKDKFYMSLDATGMGSLQKQVYNGKSGYTVAQGQRKELEGEELASVAEQAQLFAERNYLGSDYTLELAGVEKIEGEIAAKLLITDKDGTAKTEYYSLDSKLKIKEERTASTPQGDINTATVYGSYFEVEGYMFPKKITVDTGMGQTIEFETTSVEMNNKIDKGLFK